MIEINDDNVLELLEQSITEYGGQDCTYVDRVQDVYNDQRKAEIVTGDCYYFTPGDPVDIDEDGDIEWKPMEPQPLCVVGCVFAKVGVPAKLLYDTANNSSSISYSLIELLLKHDVKITNGALRALRAAQRRQDNASTWGDALAEARIALDATEETSNA
jgi:hypothetical protein